MPDVFGVEGAGAAKPDPTRKPKKPAGRGEPDVLHGSMNPRAGEGPKQRYTQYDNESGAIMVNLPDRFAKYKRELEEDLMDEFYADPAGGASNAKSIDDWVKDWIERKERDDPDAAGPPRDGEESH